MSVIECSWQIPYSISGKKIELLSTQSLLRIWTYWVLNDSIEKMQLLSTQFQLRIWTYWVLNLEYSISTTFLGAIEYSINPILSEHYALLFFPVFITNRRPNPDPFFSLIFAECSLFICLTVFLSLTKFYFLRTASMQILLQDLLASVYSKSKIS